MIDALLSLFIFLLFIYFVKSKSARILFFFIMLSALLFYWPVFFNNELFNFIGFDNLFFLQFSLEQIINPLTLLVMGLSLIIAWKFSYLLTAWIAIGIIVPGVSWMLLRQVISWPALVILYCIVIGWWLLSLKKQINFHSSTAKTVAAA